MRTALFSCLALGAIGCAPPNAPAQPTPSPQVTGQEYTYACAGSKTFRVGFDDGFTYAVVKTDKATYQVPAVIAASGSRYSDEKVEFWEHHGEAMLNGVPGETFTDCKQTDPPPA